MSELSRRSFLISGSAVAAGTLLAPAASAKCTDPMPAKWDETVDVIPTGILHGAILTFAFRFLFTHIGENFISVLTNAIVILWSHIGMTVRTADQP